MEVQTSNNTLTRDEFVARLIMLGNKQYHDKHPFNKRMHAGALSKDEMRCWIINRFYYQQCLPSKDALVLSKLPERADRIKWRERIEDHDGRTMSDGGINSWLTFAEAAGIEREILLEGKQLLPGVKFAVDAYVNFCRNEEWWLAVASSLTEVFAPTLVSLRIGIIEEHYSWIKPSGLDYFRTRLNQAPRDSQHGIDLVMTGAKTFDQQMQALKAVEFKCNVLWSLLDAIEFQGVKR
ncbi:MAG: pyrroloquinoline-quinone synthase PqqC [Leptolyngbya sp.]|nr:pyrroloquinoline-quinone synthase PqqC [Candidatus Melainabacteria bacterium]